MLPSNDAPEMNTELFRYFSLYRTDLLRNMPFSVPYNVTDNNGVRVGDLVRYFYDDKEGKQLGMALMMVQISEVGKRLDYFDDTTVCRH